MRDSAVPINGLPNRLAGITDCKRVSNDFALVVSNNANLRNSVSPASVPPSRMAPEMAAAVMAPFSIQSYPSAREQAAKFFDAQDAAPDGGPELCERLSTEVFAGWSLRLHYERKTSHRTAAQRQPSRRTACEEFKALTRTRHLPRANLALVVGNRRGVVVNLVCRRKPRTSVELCPFNLQAFSSK